jgi:site-specific recombinase XerC
MFRKLQENLTMPGKQAKVITPPMLKRMLRHVSRSSFPARDRAMVLLSIKAGLWACEIAGLDWSMVLDPQGRVSGTINVRDDRARDPLLSRRAHEAEQLRQLVRGAV